MRERPDLSMVLLEGVVDVHTYSISTVDLDRPEETSVSGSMNY